MVTARVNAVTPEPGSHAKLVEFLRAFRDRIQYVINEIWDLDKIPSIKELHRKFYRNLRKQGFRAHHIHKIERRAKETVRATKRNKGSKPILRKLTARLDYQDYRIDFNNRTIRIAVLNDEWVKLKLKWYNYLDKYLDGSWKLGEILVSLKGDTIWVYLTFKKEVKLGEVRNVIGVDINFGSIVYTVLGNNGELISMNVLVFRGGCLCPLV